MHLQHTAAHCRSRQALFFEALQRLRVTSLLRYYTFPPLQPPVRISTTMAHRTMPSHLNEPVMQLPTEKFASTDRSRLIGTQLPPIASLTSVASIAPDPSTASKPSILQYSQFQQLEKKSHTGTTSFPLKNFDRSQFANHMSSSELSVPISTKPSITSFQLDGSGYDSYADYHGSGHYDQDNSQGPEQELQYEESERRPYHDSNDSRTSADHHRDRRASTSPTIDHNHGDDLGNTPSDTCERFLQGMFSLSTEQRIAQAKKDIQDTHKILRQHYPRIETGISHSRKYRFSELKSVAPSMLGKLLSGKWINIWPCDTLYSAELLFRKNRDNPTCKIGVVNMADEFEPGGLWYQGKTSQEQSLIYRSTLAQSLHQKFYPISREEIVYSPDVYVFRGSRLEVMPADACFYVDMITCPAPRNPRTYHVSGEDRYL